MMPDDAATLMRFDDVLDGLVEGRGRDAADLDPALLATFDRLRAATSDISPDPVFASGLRQSLMQRAPVEAIRTNANAPLRLTLAPATRWVPSGRWWPRVELAAMVLVIGLLASVIAGGDV